MTLAVVAVGDVAPQRPFRQLPASALRLSGSTDVVFANVEITLTSGGEPQEKALRLRTDPARAADIRGLPADVVTVANNHAMDYGWAGMAETIRALRTADVEVAGAGADEDEAFAPAVVQRDGLRIGFLGVACTLPNGCGAGPARPGIAGVRILSRLVLDPVTIDETPGVAPWVETECLPTDRSRIAERVAAAKNLVDVLVVGIHWGIPPGWRAAFQGWRADYQQPLGRMLVDAGADAIVGHHAHTLHGIEVYRSRPIAYGLGNFLFHGLADQLVLDREYPPYATESLDDRVGGVVRLEWDVARPEAGPRTLVWPVRLNADGEPRVPAPEKTTGVLERLNGLCGPMGASLRLVETPHGPVGEVVSSG